MKRKIENYLKKWKEYNGQYALLIEGARRVGKTYSVKEFGNKYYKSCVFLDLAKKEEETIELFNNISNLDQFFLFLSVLTGVKLYERETLIIFDEVQTFPKARQAIKYLVEDGRYDYIETGSLLSIKENVKDILLPSEEISVKMHPMDFHEYLIARGQEPLIEAIKYSFEKRKPLGQTLHRKCMNYFKEYMIVGGMPQAVNTMLNTMDFDQVDSTKRYIIKIYKEDVGKFAGAYAPKVRKIFNLIPANLSKENKRFNLSSLGNNARYRNYEDSIYWLDEAQLVNLCYRCTEPNIGLKLNIDDNIFKCYMADTGLLLSHTFDDIGNIKEIYKLIINGKLEFNAGMITENIISQELIAAGHNLYYYTSKSEEKNRIEIDFLILNKKISSRHNICPLEVKSSKRYTLSSLRKFINKFEHMIDTPYVLHIKDLSVEDKITYIPLYMASLL